MNGAVARLRVPWWTGLPFTIAAAAGWIALVVDTPTTTYHFAPTVVAAAWPVARRLRLGDRLPAKAVAVSTGGGAAFALAITVALRFAGALAGPTFFGPDGAVLETWVMAGLGTLIGLMFALRSSRAKDGEGSTSPKKRQGAEMTEFTVHDENTAPEEVAPALAKANERFGFIPNMFGVLAESPQAYNAYQAVSDQFRKTSLSSDAQQVVWLTVSRNNGCEYCVAVHPTPAMMARLDAAVIEAIREDKPIDDRRLEAVRRFTKAVVELRGWVPEEELDAFFEAGFAQRQVLDILTGVAMKMLSNYTNHIAHTLLDDAFAPFAWTDDDQ